MLGDFCNFHIVLFLVSILFAFSAGLIVSTMLSYSLLETPELSREGKIASSSLPTEVLFDESILKLTSRLSVCTTNKNQPSFNYIT